MAFETKVNLVTFTSGSLAAGHLNKFAVINSSGQAVLNTTAQGPVDGIFGEEITASTAGLAVPLVQPDGCIAKVVAGAAITNGDLVGSDTVGRAITHVAGAGAVAVGRALQAATAAGQVISIHFMVERAST